MPSSQGQRSGRGKMGPDDVLNIQRQVQNLEFQVQKLRQNIDGESQQPDVPTSHGPVSYRAIREMLDARRLRDRYFGQSLFGEPAWDILLELYASELAQVRITVSQLCIGAAVPATTALRWIGNLEAGGLLTRHKDKLDGRRVFVFLTDKAREAFRSYFDSVPCY